jgi:uncharacterized protein (DUF983 family)
MTLNFPKWVRILIIIVAVIIVCVIFKVNVHGNLGSEGIGASITQGLVH